MNNESSFQTATRTLAACITGMTGMGGGLFLLDMKSIKASVLDERRLVALGLVAIFSLLLAAVPAGWAAGKHFDRTPFRVWLAMTGAYLTPMLSWFAGLDVRWPVSWLVAAVLIFAGSWLGYGLSFLFRRKDPVETRIQKK